MAPTVIVPVLSNTTVRMSRACSKALADVTSTPFVAPRPVAAVTDFKQAIEASDGLLFVSPEYNRSIPGALKNAIDWGSRPWGHNSFARKPTGIIGASPGAIGTALMQASMRVVLSFLNAPQLNAPEAYITFKPELYGPDGEVHDEATAKFLRHYMDEYAAFVERVLSSTLPGHVGDRDE